MDKLKASHPVLAEQAARLGASDLDIQTILGLIQKFGSLAEKVLADILPFVPAGNLATVMTLIDSLLKALNPTA